MIDQGYIWNLIAKKLSLEASPEELQELENLLHKYPELHYSLQTIIDLWDSSATQTLSNQEKAHEAFEKHLTRMQELQIDFPLPGPAAPIYESLEDNAFPSRKRNALLWSALSIAVLAGLLFAGLKLFTPTALKSQAAELAPHEKTTSEISTKNGSKTNVVLPDGTVVWLNAGSKLSYDKSYGNTLREITLTGEAFFDVVHNAEKPFVIHTSNINIKVLGTKFNVKSYPSDKNTEATLIRGSIEVSFKDRPAEKIILKPNEKIVVSNDHDNATVLKPINAKIEQKHRPEPIVAVRNLTYYQHSTDVVETSWVENKLIFQDESFEDLASQLERWYGVTISFKNPEMEELHFTGNFKNESIVQALDALKLSNNFNYTINGNMVTIFK